MSAFVSVLPAFSAAAADSCRTAQEASADSSAHEASVQLWRMINDARIHPVETMESFGIDEAAAKDALGKDAGEVARGLAPIAWNDSLAGTACNHNDDMIDNLYYSSTGPDGTTVSDRIFSAGYNADKTGELLGIVAFSGYMTPLEAAKIIFKNWVKTELDPGIAEEKKIFNPEFSEMGISIKAAVVDLGEDHPSNIYLAVADFATPFEHYSFLFGNVYQDANNDGLMEPGEGVSGVMVIVESYLTGSKQWLAPDATGIYRAMLPNGFFTVDVIDAAGNILTKQAGFGDGRNILMDLNVK